MDWRGSSSGAGHSSRGAHSHSKHSFTGGGNKHTSASTSSSSSNSAFSGRSRGCVSGGAGASSRTPTSTTNTSVSIPLVAPVAAGGAGTSDTHTKYTSQKYVSKFKKTSDKVEDTILNTILLGKLNKFSEINYDEIKEFIMHIIDNGETDMIKCFMKLVFEKAASEEIFCPLYAKLLSELSSRYPVLLTEMANLYVQYMAIFEEVKEDEAETYNEFCKRNVEQKYRRGYSQFLAELTKHNVIDSATFMKTVMKIITQVNINIKNKEAIKLIEEYADCLQRIMRAIKPSYAVESDIDDMIASIRSTIKGEPLVHITPLTIKNAESVGLSNKARFTFLNICEDIQKF
jgi:hypothetical protein